MTDPYVCPKCDRACELTSRYEGGPQGWLCPCCRSWTRTAEMIETDMRARADERGLTLEQLHQETMARFIDPKPLSPRAEAGLRSLVAKRAEEWQPACEHDTENPWAAPHEESS